MSFQGTEENQAEASKPAFEPSILREHGSVEALTHNAADSGTDAGNYVS
ncbi:hypothetical protein P7L78_12295 [Tistrella bauzanensis]|jgi:hypothetical protein